MNEPPFPATIPCDAPAIARSVRASRQAAVLAAIDARASEIGLDPANVAGKLGLSVRYLHRLLQATGRTFAQHLLDRRLAIAIALLRDPQYAHLTIGQIAAQAGFADRSHFSRRFRRAFGDTPYGMRARAAAGYAASSTFSTPRRI